MFTIHHMGGVLGISDAGMHGCDDDGDLHVAVIMHTTNICCSCQRSDSAAKTELNSAQLAK